jgi:hypothetical protein
MVRAGAQLGDETREAACSPASVDEKASPDAHDESVTIHEHFLRGPRAEQQVLLHKETSGQRIGIGLRPDMPDRAVVNTVAPDTPASQPRAPGSAVPLIEPYDELVEVAGVPCTSAVHAVQLIREAPAGELVIRKLCRPEKVWHSISFVQESARAALARHGGVTRRALLKPLHSTVLGLSFSPDYAAHSFIRKVSEGGAAARVLEEGDRVVRLNGARCSAPGETARRLREAVGRIELHIERAAQVNHDEVAKVEEAVKEQERQRQLEEEASRAAHGAEESGQSEDDDDEYAHAHGMLPVSKLPAAHSHGWIPAKLARRTLPLAGTKSTSTMALLKTTAATLTIPAPPTARQAIPFLGSGPTPF